MDPETGCPRQHPIRCPPLEHPGAARADELRARTRPFGPEPVTAFARPPVGDFGGRLEGLMGGATRTKRPQPSPPFMRGEGRDPDEAGAKNRGGIPPQEPAKRRGSGLSHRSRKDDKNPDLNGVKTPGQKGPMGSGRELVAGTNGPINGCIPGPTKGQFGDGHSRFPLKAPFGPGNLGKSHGGKAARRTR